MKQETDARVRPDKTTLEAVKLLRYRALLFELSAC